MPVEVADFMIRRISVRDLRPGMFVTAVADGWVPLSQGVSGIPGYVHSADEILALARQGYREVFVDMRAAVSGGRRVSRFTDGNAQARDLDRELERLPDGQRGTVISAQRDDPMGEQLDARVRMVRACYGETLRVVGELFTAAAQGRAVRMSVAREAVQLALDTVPDDSAAWFWAARLEQYGAWLHVHSVNVFALSLQFGLDLGLKREALTCLGVAALLHDVGQTRLPVELTVRRGPFSDVQEQVFRTHCIEGEALLRQQPDVPPSVLRAVREHHERHDGQGYPDGLAGDRRGLFGRILALADALERMMGTGSQGERVSPAQAVNLLYAGRGRAHAEEDLERFIRFAGVFPPGSMVRISDGRYGMVWRHDPEHPMSPLVNVAYDETRRPISPVRVPLAAAGLRAERAMRVQLEQAHPQRLAPA